MSRKLSIIGIVLTAVYFLLLCFMFNGRIVEILLMKPNEIGDLLAGAFGPLAILWLILGFFQQGFELRQNTAALKLQEEALKAQAMELNQSVQQQRELVAVSKQQLDVGLETIRLEQEQLRGMASPNFVLDVEDIHIVGDGKFSTRMAIRNVGQTATNMSFFSNAENNQFSPLVIPSLPNNQSYTMYWYAGESSLNSELHVLIRYSDSLGIDGECVFDLEVSKNERDQRNFKVLARKRR